MYPIVEQPGLAASHEWRWFNWRRLVSALVFLPIAVLGVWSLNPFILILGFSPLLRTASGLIPKERVEIDLRENWVSASKHSFFRKTNFVLSFDEIKSLHLATQKFIFIRETSLVAVADSGEFTIGSKLSRKRAVALAIEIQDAIDKSKATLFQPSPVVNETLETPEGFEYLDSLEVAKLSWHPDKAASIVSIVISTLGIGQTIYLLLDSRPSRNWTIFGVVVVVVLLAVLLVSVRNLKKSLLLFGAGVIKVTSPKVNADFNHNTLEVLFAEKHRRGVDTALDRWSVSSYHEGKVFEVAFVKSLTEANYLMALIEKTLESQKFYLQS